MERIIRRHTASKFDLRSFRDCGQESFTFLQRKHIPFERAHRAGSNELSFISGSGRAANPQQKFGFQFQFLVFQDSVQTNLIFISVKYTPFNRAHWTASNELGFMCGSGRGANRQTKYRLQVRLLVFQEFWLGNFYFSSKESYIIR
jgi:hypothetical protein